MSLLILFTEPRRFTLSVETGSYALTVNDVGLFHERFIAVGTAFYTLTANSVGLIYTAVAGRALIGTKIGGLARRLGLRIGDRR